MAANRPWRGEPGLGEEHIVAGVIAEVGQGGAADEDFMKEPHLRVVDESQVYDLGKTPESVPERARRLHLEAQILAAEEVEELRASLGAAVGRAERIAEGGEIFPVGVREQARQLAGSLPLVMQTLQALSDRHMREVTGEPVPPIWKESDGGAAEDEGS